VGENQNGCPSAKTQLEQETLDIDTQADAG